MQPPLPGPEPDVPVAAVSPVAIPSGVLTSAAGSSSPSVDSSSPAATASRLTANAERGLALAERILALSHSAGQQGSARLPTERQLSVDLGVTRSSVRSALALLEAQGRISREVGRGTFLREPLRSGHPAAAADAIAVGPVAPVGPVGTAIAEPMRADFAPADVMTIRQLLEPPAMALVVAWATAADLEQMERCLELGDRAATFEEFESCDLALHRCIMAASHSPLLVSLYAAIEAARHGYVWGDLKRRQSSPERRGQYQADHRAIVAALRSRDSGGAAEAMRLHLSRVQEHLSVFDPAAGLTWR